MAAFPTFPPDYRRRFVEAGLWLDRTLYDYFSETVRNAPDRVALVAGERRITFADWADEAERLAAGLVRLGITKGDIVSVQLPNWPEMCMLQVALARIGAVIQPVHMVYRQREMASMLRFCESRAVILPATYRGFDYAGALAEIRNELPALEFAVVVRGTHDGWVSYDDLCAWTSSSEALTLTLSQREREARETGDLRSSAASRPFFPSPALPAGEGAGEGSSSCRPEPGRGARVTSEPSPSSSPAGNAGEEIRMGEARGEGSPADCLAEYEAAHPVSADDVFYLNFTSGTEGDPKGFLHTHNTLLSVLKRFADLQAKFDTRSAAEVMLANSPMSHSFGHLATYQVFLRGIRMVLVERFEAEETLRIIERERVTSISGTPAHLVSLLNHPDFARFDLGSVRSVGVGGAQCPPQLMAEIKEKFRVRTGNTYGMGENIVHTRTLPKDPPEVIRDTVGLPVPGAELKIFADDHQTELAAGSVGEIAFRGPTLFVGYYKNPELTEATRNADGWFFTGDLGFVDERGYLHLAGRKKELINRGGTKIFPNEIEDLLHAHPKILKAAVIGMPDYRLGERVCAYVVPHAGETVTLEEIRAYLTDCKVMKYKFPERLEVVGDLPLTPTGKVKKEPLLQDIQRKLATT